MKIILAGLIAASSLALAAAATAQETYGGYQPGSYEQRFGPGRPATYDAPAAYDQRGAYDQRAAYDHRGYERGDHDMGWHNGWRHRHWRHHHHHYDYR